MTKLIGNAPDSWGVWFPEDSKQPSWTQFLDEVALAEFEWTELGPYGYLPTDPKTLRRELDARSLKLSGGAISLPLEEPDFEAGMEQQLVPISSLITELGAGYLVLIGDFYDEFGTPNLRKPRRLDEAAWGRFVDRTNKVGRFVKEKFGLVTVFHPHAGTHVEYEDQIERLLAETDPDIVSLCLDTGHHAYCGGDAVAFADKHHARIKYLHLKNVTAKAVAKAHDEGMNFVFATAKGACTCLDEGVVDFAAFKAVLDKHGLEVPLVVEQDIYPTPLDRPLAIARQNRAVLRNLGFG